MDQPGLDHRHRDKNGEISRKHGNTLVSTLRKVYGPAFATGQPDHATLRDALVAMDDRSLTQLVNDHQNAALAGKIEQENKLHA